MNSKELRRKYLKFFEEKGHKVIPSASLVPANDPTVLFTTAGMHPLVPYLLGQEHPAGKRLTNVQKSLRTDDIDEVGDDTHNTFFEMLGNWSLGDYWKEEAIKWSYEFLTDKKWLGLDHDKLKVTIFAGDKDAPKDEESAKIWKSLGFTDDRIEYLGKKDNWWGPPGQTGPCGPDTEVFYKSGKEWVEIWNNVFMQYNKTADGKFEPLKQRNVDTGMGMERITAVLEGKSNIYETELFLPIMDQVKKVLPSVDQKSQRIITDHLRASIFLLSDGVQPSNKDRGYILRRLIRRAVAQGFLIDKYFDSKKVGSIANVIVATYKEPYPELDNDLMYKNLSTETRKFRKTLDSAINELKKMFPLGGIDPENHPGVEISNNILRIDGKKLFDLYQSHGLPIEIAQEIMTGWGVTFDEQTIKEAQELFKQEFVKHQELSRTASAGQFKGGLASHSDKIVRLHTATHLMNAALRQVLSDGVSQKGSNITEERTRFDFTHDKKMTDEEKVQVEKLVNDWIARDLAVKKEMMSQNEAKKLGAIGVFGEKYADTVSIYTIFDPKTKEVMSREFCGGPHVEHTSVIGKFKIQKEEAVSAGVRRIKAVVE